jgi:Rv2175c C-terminal domain of unknown function
MTEHPVSDLRSLVADWLDEGGVAAALGVTVAQVRTMVRRHELAAIPPAPGAPAAVPALFVQDGEVVKGLPGLLTLLADGGYDATESVVWIFTDADLPGRPIDALRENRGSEVKRRAQAMAF